MRKSRKTQKTTKPRKIWFVLGIILLAVLVTGIFLYRYEMDLVFSNVTIEAGSIEPDVTEFLKHDARNVSFTEASTFSCEEPGDFQLEIVWDIPLLGERGYETTLHVVDTTAPKITLKSDEVQIYTTGEYPEAEDLVESVTDVTECSVDFAAEYDFSKAGQITLTVVARDTSGNESKETISADVIEDTEGPEITGVEPLTVSIGDTISYKKDVTVTDNYDENPTLTVDDDSVNLGKRGTYSITYVATDAAGNTSRKTTTVKVVSSKIAAATEETVYGKADEVLAEILTDGMTQKEEARAIFDWVVDNITYSEHEGIDDLLSAAYAGLFHRRGDCTVKQKTAEVLLNRAGIKCMEIQKIPDTRNHYWLLIDIGEGWYHYDPNLQLDGTLIFYWHDADLWAYSNAHKNTHNYDPSKYPEIQ